MFSKNGEGMKVNKAIRTAGRYFQSGNLEEAEHIYREILKYHPDNIDAYNNLGSILQEKGELDEAISCYRKAIELDPDFAGAYYNLGDVLQEKGELDEAIICYGKAIEFAPQFVWAYNNLANALVTRKQSGKALFYYQKAIGLDPNFIQAYINLGNVLRQEGKLDDATAYYQKALQINRDCAEAYNNLGYIYIVKERFDEAISFFYQALRVRPDFAEAYSNLGNALMGKGSIDDAIAACQNAIRLTPHSANAYYSLGIALRARGNLNEAVDAFESSLRYDSHNMKAHWARCMSQLKAIYPDQQGIQISRARYYEELIKLRGIVSLETAEDIDAAAASVGSMQPFLLPYQGFNDRELQQMYGEMVCRIMAARYPHFADRLPMPPRLSGKPLRVGLVSGYFYHHSNWKIPIKGWVENIDKRRFRLYGYYTGRKKDRETDVARRCFDRFIEDVFSFEALCKIIKDDNLHVLIYPEIGMDPTTLRLASLRLAPVQCTSWGQPETSGLPTIDYFLSSDLMEPSDADDYYSEKLIRLTNLSIHYFPFDISEVALSREEFGLRPESVLYLCCQSLFKYLPQYDAVYPRIARRVEDCRFLFISDKNIGESLVEQFRLRTYEAFNQFGMDAAKYIVFLPFLSPERYKAINRLSDVYLDSIGWSGCNSTFEALANDLPVVTLPGEFMRGRHSAAILTMMGMTETVTSTIDEYIGLAVKLGTDSAWRRQIAEKIADSKDLIYRDRFCIAALENFLEKVVKDR